MSSAGVAARSFLLGPVRHFFNSTTTEAAASASASATNQQYLALLHGNAYYKLLLSILEAAMGDPYLTTAFVILIGLVIFVAVPPFFSRPPHVPKKVLPARPALSIQFKPDDDTAIIANSTTTGTSGSGEGGGDFVHKVVSQFKTAAAAATQSSSSQSGTNGGVNEIFLDSFESTMTNAPANVPGTPKINSGADSLSSGVGGPGQGQGRQHENSGDGDNISTASSAAPPPPTHETPLRGVYDLPDSFAPLLSSSQTEMLLDHLTADLIHGVVVDASLSLRSGKHEIPLDKSGSRPQFQIHVPMGGCKLTASAAVGSDGFTQQQDLDPTIQTQQRTLPMVKHSSLVFDPPLPLLNVAPTLIHIPTLFDDTNVIPTLRRIPVVRLLMEFVVSISNYIERVLWILESFLQIHLTKVRIVPVYKGKTTTTTKRNKMWRRSSSKTTTTRAGNQFTDVADGNTTIGGTEMDTDDNFDETSNNRPGEQEQRPDWRLSLAFSGHCLLFSVIPVPFINVVLPSFLIPQPHAFLEYLLSKQPLASAKLKRENIAEQKLAIAFLDMTDQWSSRLQLVATPPAVGIDLNMPGGVCLGMELLHGRDIGAGRSRTSNHYPHNQLDTFSVHETNTATPGGFFTPTATGTPTGAASRTPAQNVGDADRGGAGRQLFPPSSISMSSWTSPRDNNVNSTNNNINADNRRQPFRPNTAGRAAYQAFNANNLVPWKLDVSAKGHLEKEKISFYLVNCSLEHTDDTETISGGTTSRFKTRGSLALWKAPGIATGASGKSIGAKSPFARRSTFVHRAALVGTSPSIAEMLLFPDNQDSFYRGSEVSRMLQYDYAFDVSEDSKVDAITLSVGATHPMLNGGSMVTTILESIYAYGSFTARENAALDPIERQQKRNVLRHLPAIDFTFGVNNCFIPPESNSFTDDGQTKTIPSMDGGRLMVRFLGGIEQKENARNANGRNINIGIPGANSLSEEPPVDQGIKVVADIGVSSIVLDSETSVKEFPELDVFEGTKLRSFTSADLGGNVKFHLKPMKLTSAPDSAGPNIFNPLEAYEIDFSGSSVSARIREAIMSLGHRRIIIPTETTLKARVVESRVDMTFYGQTDVELLWDFQGLSPILQVTDVGLEPESVNPERKEQVSLLIAPLRQGRLNLHVSPVGGLTIAKAETSREDKEGLYDWKFFNALVSSSPDQESTDRLVDVIHDKRTMRKMLQVSRLINSDLYKVLEFILTRVWRLKDIMEDEEISDPKHIIPGHRLARLLSLLLVGDLTETQSFLQIIRRVVAGNGLDVVKVKELLRENVAIYDDWTPEIDRAIRWCETMFAPTTVPASYVEENVTPLVELEQYRSRFKGLPSAAEIYAQIIDRPDLPLTRSFSNLVGRIAPYLSFRQISYFLKVRSAKDWQPSDLKRLRYVMTIKRKVMDIAESYGGLSFLPQSFLVSVFLGEATRASLKVSTQSRHSGLRDLPPRTLRISHEPSTLASLRKRRTRLQEPSLADVQESPAPQNFMTPAAKVASVSNFLTGGFEEPAMYSRHSGLSLSGEEMHSQYELGDCLLGPPDVATLLQAGLTSVMKGSSVVQLNQRMLLDLVAGQPKSFAVAVLAEIGTPGGQGSPRQLTSALMALLELDQSSFRPIHRLDITKLLESWLPGMKVPRREDYMAGGRWARQSYYEAIFSLSKNILEDAEVYMAVKFHLQRQRLAKESDPISSPKAEPMFGGDDYTDADGDQLQSKLQESINIAEKKIETADQKGKTLLPKLLANAKAAKRDRLYKEVVNAYNDSFQACSRVRDLDKLAFQSGWFRVFYERNYNALMVKSVYDNVIEDVDNVRYWMHCLRRGAKYGPPKRNDERLIRDTTSLKNGREPFNVFEKIIDDIRFGKDEIESAVKDGDRTFLEPERTGEQELVTAIIDALIYDENEREKLRNDPLVRLLIPNPEGKYDFTIVTAMGVITDGKAGTELENALERLKKKRGVEYVRSDTATARSFEYNAEKIIDAIDEAREIGKPFGLLGYSQGCANILMAESLLFAGTPEQSAYVQNNLLCRQLLFSAANGSSHGPATDKKVSRLIVMVEEFVKSQQGYFSRSLQSAFIEMNVAALDSPQFHKLMGGADGFLYDGCRAFWREAQHLPHVPTCVMRGVLEEHTTPEALEMLTNMLTKQSGSALHDSQVHVYDAVGHPVYHHNRNGKVLERCEVGSGAIQRTHHWSPLNKEVSFLSTERDQQLASFDCAKDRHIFPWVDVNVRFGFIKTEGDSTTCDC
mmetsp:Transcript_36708/g.88723  ORF Transcript_36708/g.88723 Transcript_36708/m.88723 type:complete len:2250 (+) Transcript_36708:90-6839(+)